MEKFVYKNNSGITALSASLKEFSYKKHSHEEYALGVTLRGTQEYHLDGCFQASHKSGVMLFNSEQAHDGRAQDYKNGLDYTMLYIKPKLLLEGLEEKEMIRFKTPVVYDQKLATSIYNLSSAILNNKEDALCNELFLNVMDNLTSKDLYSRFKKDGEFIKKAKDLMLYEIENVLNLDDICYELGISKFHFIRSFKASTGFSPYQYFLNTKVIEAKKHLEKHRDIYATIVEYGFVDLSHFNKHFKKIHGITPFEYLASLSTK